MICIHKNSNSLERIWESVMQCNQHNMTACVTHDYTSRHSVCRPCVVLFGKNKLMMDFFSDSVI